MASIMSTAYRYSHRGRKIQRCFRSSSLCVNWNDNTNKSDDKASHHRQPQTYSSLQSSRNYHVTAKKEILPLIAAAVGIGGYYSYRALKMMDHEWEEYQEDLKEYNLEHGIQDNEDSLDGGNITTPTSKPQTTTFNKAKAFKGGTMAIDLGTLNVRIAHRSSSADSRPSVMVNREGKRSTPNHIIFESDGSFVTGKLASAKEYEKSDSANPVVNSGQMMRNSEDDTDPSIRNHMIQQVISSCAKDALEQAIGRKNISSPILFALDHNYAYNVQPIFVYPPKQSSRDDDILDEYKDALRNLSLPDSIAEFVPEPLCAVNGAKFYSLLPNAAEGPVLVIDVGARSTSMSIVEGDNVKYHSRLSSFGGESLVEALMKYVTKSFYKNKYEVVSDKMALQRIYDATKDAVFEISSGSKNNLGRVQLNIPYLSIDEKMQPIHLDLGVSAKVLEAEFNDMIAKEIIPEFAMKQGVLSKSTQNPSDLSSLFTSMIMQVLEKSSQNPFALNSVLIVGGGARSPLIQKAIKTSVSSLAGEQFVQEKVVLPRDELIEELIVLGAALQ